MSEKPQSSYRFNLKRPPEAQLLLNIDQSISDLEHLMNQPNTSPKILKGVQMLMERMYNIYVKHSSTTNN